MRTTIIVNPMANKGACGHRWSRLRTELEQVIGPVPEAEVVMTRARDHATTLAREAVRSGFRRLVAVGGDGTFNEVLNGVIVGDALLAPDIVLAQLPAGTSNEVSRTLGQRTATDTGRSLLTGETTGFDVFRAKARAHAGGPDAVRYGCILALSGAPATIAWRAQRMPLLKRLGSFGYVVMTAITSATYRPQPYRVRFDDDDELTLPVWGLLLCSLEGAGESLMLAPGADPSDGRLDVILLGDLGRWETLSGIVPRLGDGSYLSRPKVSRRHAARVSVESDRDVLADVDGESIGRLPMTVSLLPYRIAVAGARPKVTAAPSPTGNPRH